MFKAARWRRHERRPHASSNRARRRAALKFHPDKAEPHNKVWAHEKWLRVEYLLSCRDPCFKLAAADDMHAVHKATAYDVTSSYDKPLNGSPGQDKIAFERISAELPSSMFADGEAASAAAASSRT